MLVGGLTFIASAEEPADLAMLLDDISVGDTSLTGGMGYIVNDHYINEYDVKAWGSDTEPWAVEDINGISVAFDLNIIAISQCTHLVNEQAPNDFRHTQGLVFTFSNYSGFQAIIYDAVKQEFQIANVGWPVSVVPIDGSHIIESAPFPMKPGEWHRCFYNIYGSEVFVYCDGKLVISHDFDGGPMNNLNRCFLMFWESHVRLMMDNLIVGTDEYDDTLGDTFQEKIDANNGETADEKFVLFSDDFNDAIEITYDHEVTVPVWEIAKDDKDREIEDVVLNEDGTPKLDERGREIKEKRILLDEKGNKVQAVDDKGELMWEPEYHFIKEGQDTIEPEQEHAGFTFGVGVHNTSNLQCRPVDKATYSGMIKDIDGAVINCADGGAVEGQTISVEVTIDPKSASFTEAKDLIVSLDPIFTFNGVENVASGATVEVDANQLASIKIPAGFSGKLCDLVLHVPVENEMAQSSKYRYGFLVGEKTVFKNGSAEVDPETITIDGGMIATQNFKKGDANGDGNINAKDVITTMKYIGVNAELNKSKNAVPTEKQQKTLDALRVKAADVYSDGKINARDVNLLMKFIVFGEWK